MIQLVFRGGDRGGGPGHGAARDRLQPARGRRAGRVGRRSSSSSTGRTRSSTSRPARTRTSSPRASTWDARPSRGVCDDTTGPHEEIRPQVLSIPSDPEAARTAFWIAFQGRWGERQQAFYNGPTGPNLKTQWTEPVTWSEDWRDRSYAVPAGGAFGTDATDFFCNAVEAGSNFVLRAVDDGGRLALVLGVVAAALIFLLTRTSWRPSTPLRVPRRRSWGQTRPLRGACTCCGRGSSSGSASW